VSRPRGPTVRRPRLDFPWTLAVAAAAVVATAIALSASPADHRVARAMLAEGHTWREPWRALTGPLVHATWGHLVRDVALTLIVGVAYEAPLGRRWPALIAAGLVLPALAVLASGAGVYYGLSGLSHALLAAALGFELRRRRGRARGYVAIVAAGLAIKVGYELVTGAPAFPMDLGPGVRQVPLAHAVGVALGALIGGVSGRGSRRSRRARSSPAPRPTRA
jgi:rhomboid family GlyGly-CTERM serine protease